MSEVITFIYQAKLTRQSVLNFLDNESEEYLKKECAESFKYDVSELSGVFAIYEQFPSVNGESRARPVIMDVHTNIIIDDLIIPTEELDIKFKEEFLRKNLKDKKVKGMVSDGDKAYSTIIDDMGWLHVLCNFHLMQNLMNDLKKPINHLKRKIKSNNNKIEKINEKLPFYKYKKVRKKNEKKVKMLKSETRDLNKELKKLNNLKERISNIFSQNDVKNAKRRFKLLYNTRNNLPSVVSKFIRRLNKTFEKTVNHMIYDFLPRTNNQLECYNGVSLPDNQKRIYRTDRGLERTITLGRKRWMDRNRKTIVA
ncbi:MAG: transposase [Methanobrevibacter sp.]|nr:transposase [Methanobrevibacter sp.]